MRVLVACEYSGVVRDAFKAAGHYALSCDLLPTDVPGEHYQGDVFAIIRNRNNGELDHKDLIVDLEALIHRRNAEYAIKVLEELKATANKHRLTGRMVTYLDIAIEQQMMRLELSARRRGSKDESNRRFYQ